MRELIVTQNITLDGVIDTAGGWFSPAGDDTEVDQADVEAAHRKQWQAADALLLGRVTLEEMRGYWPLQTNDTTGITDYLITVSKYVVSSTMQDPQWEQSTVLKSASAEQIQALKSAPGKDIVTTGGMTLVRELIAAQLVDEYRLFLYPVVLGVGKRLFADATTVPGLRLVEAQPFRCGIVLLRYRTV